MRYFILILVFSTILATSNASIYSWNGTAYGLWTDNRWVVDASTGPLTCCPSVNDDAVIRIDPSAPSYIQTVAGLEVSSLEVGPSISGFTVFVLFNTGGIDTPFKASSFIKMNANALLQMVGALTIPPGKNATFGPQSAMWLNQGTVSCEVQGDCLLDLNGGSLATFGGNKALQGFIGVNIRNYYPYYQSTYQQESRIYYANCTVDIVGVTTRLISARLTLSNSSLLMDTSNLVLYYDPNSYTFFGLMDQSVAIITNSAVYSVGSPVLLENADALFDGNGQLSLLSFKNGSYMSANREGSITIRDYSVLSALFDNSRLVTVNNGNIFVQNSTLQFTNHASVGASTGGSLIFTNTTIKLEKDSAFYLYSNSYANISGSLELDDSSYLICYHSLFSAATLSLGLQIYALNCSFQIEQNLVAITSYLLFSASRITISGDAKLESRAKLFFENATVVVNGAFLALDSYFQSVFSNFSLNGGFEFGNCTPVDVEWNLHDAADVTAHDSCVVLFQTSLVQIQGNMVLAANSSTKMLNVSLDLSGTMPAYPGSLLRLHYSRLRVSGSITLLSSHTYSYGNTFDLAGGLLVDNCTSAPKDPKGGIDITKHRSCVTILEQNTFSSNGSISFGKNSSTLFISVTANLNGTMSVDSYGSLVIDQSTFDVFGELVFGDSVAAMAAFSSLRFASGRMRMQRNVFFSITASSFSLAGSEVILEPGALIQTLGSRSNISAGSLYFRGDSVLATNEASGFMSALGSEAIMSGGQIFVDKKAVFGAFANSTLRVQGGSLLFEADASLQMSDNSTVEISGGNIEMNSSSFRLFSRGILRVLGGDIRLRNQSQINTNANCKIFVVGSIYLQESSINMADSQLEISSGSIVMDSTSNIRLVRSSIIGIGSINGSVELTESTLTFAESSSTQLSVGSFLQSNNSVVEANIAANYTTGTSTSVHSRQGVNVTGTLVLTVDASIGDRLRKGEAISLISSDEYVSGGFSLINITGSADLTCGISIESTAKSLSLVFNPNNCPVPAPGTGAAPFGSGGENALSLNVAALAASLVVVAVVFVAAVITVLMVPRLRNAVMPWRQHQKESNQRDLTATDAGNEAEMSQPPTNKTGWTQGKINK